MTVPDRERSPHAFNPLSGGGEMGALMRSIDWSTTAVGPVESWPQSLRTALSILLETGFPMYIAWGPGFTQFYNDGYRPILGSTKHPAAMGISTRETFAEIWDIIGPMFDGVMQGTPTTVVDFLLPLDRHGFIEECYFIFSYSPIREERGSVGGILVTVTETTGRVLGARRMKTLQDLAARTKGARTAGEASAIAAEVLAENPADLPFSIVYLLDRDGTQARMACAAGITASPLTPPCVEAGGDDPWGVWHVATTKSPVLLDELPAGVAAALDRTSTPAVRAFALPIVQPGADAPTGVLIAGLSARLLLDADYRSFLTLVAAQVGMAIASARALEEAKARVDALAELDRAKTDFFMNVSHEFRTPLTLLLGPTEDALAHRDRLTPEDADRWALVHRSGLRLLKLVNTLLDFSRIEAGRSRASYEPVDLAATTTDLASVFRSAIERAGLRLVVDVPALDEPVYIDRDMWEKIVLNLLSNALKFTFEGEITVTLRRDGDRVALTVRDTGVGVPPEETAQLFDRFHRVQGTRARTHEGTGIGLALVQQLVTLHGGAVTVESAVGRGTSFTVRIPFGRAHLPADRIGQPRTLSSTSLGSAPFTEEALRWLPDSGHSAPKTDAARPGPVAPGGSRMRVLLADDNADMREYVARLLSERWAVETAADGTAALARALESPPDLVLSDVMMPGMDGFQLLHALRADPRTRTIPVVFLSARAGEESRIEGLEAGADDYLAKPFSARELMARVSTHLELSRLRAEADRERRRLYQSFMQAPVPICVLRGPDLIYELANPLYEDLVGRRGLVGKPIREALPELPSDAPILQVFERVYASGESFVADEYRVLLDRRSAGAPEEAFFKFRAEPMRNGESDVFGVMAVAIDVTDQVRIRREVDAARRLLEEVVSQLPAGVIIAEAATGNMLLVNGQIEKLLGYSPKQMDAIDPALHFNPILPDGTTDPHHVSTLTRALRGEVVLDREILIGRADGARRVLSASAAPVYDEAGGLVAAVATYTDVTDRRRDEDQRRDLLAREQQARQDAELASRSKDEFLAMLGHELRNPLSPILTALHLMQLQGGDVLRRERDVIERQVKHLERLVDDMLDVSRITQGRVQLKRETLEIASVIAKAIEIASPIIEQRRHHLTIQVPSHGLPVAGDPVRLAQVFSNLLTNSAKYTAPGGSIVIAAARAGDRLVVSVRDNGIGLAPDVLPHVFGLFVQGRQSLDRSEGGLGLGLAIVRSLVELHGGTVEALSDGPGCGSEFIVRLPGSDAVEPAMLMAAELAAVVIPTPLARVLVVDDNVDAAEMLAECLRASGYAVQIAHDGPSALRAAKASAPDVALLDIGLPIMDGYELAQHLRALSDVRLVALTGYGQDTDRARSLEAGFRHHLVKPVDPFGVVEIVEQLVKEPRQAGDGA